MKQVYEKYELSFSLICIAGYVVIFNIADMISHALGIEKVVTAPICVAGLIILFVWMKKMSCFQSLGYAQFLAIASCNLWNGVRIKYSSIEIVLFLLSMLCVGVIEEIIFRGFLFKAL